MKRNKYVVVATSENPALTESNKMFKAVIVLIVVVTVLCVLF